MHSPHLTAALQCARPCIASSIAASLQSRLAARLVRGCALDTHYPINFVVKHPNPFVLTRRPALGRWETCRTYRPVSKSASHVTNGGDLETVNESGGADRDRTDDPLLAKQVLSQLSYSPVFWVPAAEMVGLGRFELPTSPLSGVRSNQLSYRPVLAGSPADFWRLPGARRLRNPHSLLKRFRGQG